MIQELVSKLFWVPLRFTGQMGDMFYSAESCMEITKLKADTIWILSLFKGLPSNSRNSVGMCIHMYVCVSTRTTSKQESRTM